MAARAARKALVFVYGSLKTNFRNHYKMTGAQHVTSAVTKEAYPLVIFGERRVPYLLPFPGVGKNIRGELYSCEDDKLEELDRFERCHVGYYRKRSGVYAPPTDSWVRKTFSSCTNRWRPNVGVLRLFKIRERRHQRTPRSAAPGWVYVPT